MAEVFGVASSIIGLACLGVQLSKQLYHFGIHTIGVEADNKINRIATNVTLFSSMLKHVASVIEKSDSLHSPEATETVMQIVKECKGVFDEISKILKLSSGGNSQQNGNIKGLNRSLSFGRKVKIYFDQPRVDSLLAQLEYLKTTLSSLQEHAEQIKEERVHIETLLIARHLSIVVINQQNQQRRASAEEEGYVDIAGRISPVDSEATIEVGTQKLLTQDAAQSLSLVSRHQVGHLDFVDAAMFDEEDVTSPTTSRTHDPLIDQLLGRWTIKPHFQEPSKVLHRDDHTTAGAHIKKELESREEPTKSLPVTEASLLGQSAQSELLSEADSDAVTLVPSSPTKSRHSGDSSLGPPQDTAYSRKLGRTPSPRFNRSGPPVTDSDATTGYFGSNEIKSAASLPHRSSISQVFSDESAAILTEENQMCGSPQPLVPVVSSPVKSNTPSMQALPALHTPLSLPPPSSSALHATSPRLSTTTAPPQNRQYQARVSPSTSRGSSFDSETDDEIPWRIRVGSRFWNILDGRVVGPRNPEPPSEKLSQLYTLDYATTEIADLWASEAAIAEKGYPYQRIPLSEAGESPDEIRWRIFMPLKFDDIQALVHRTNEIERLRDKAAPTSPIASQPTRVAAQMDPRLSAPLASQSNSYFGGNYQSGPPHHADLRSNPQQRPNSLHSQWPTYPGTAGLSPGAAPPPNTPQLRSPPSQQRTVSFAGSNAPSSTGTRGGARHGSLDRSPRSSTDFPQQNHRPSLPQQQSGGYWPQQQNPMSPTSSQAYSTFSGAGVPPPPSPYMPGFPNGASVYPQQQQQPQQPIQQGHWPTYPPQSQPQQRYEYAPSSRNDESEKRERRRERSRSRSSSRSRSRSRERDRERSHHRKKDREKQKKESWSKKGKVAAGTMGTIGGLAALLEGLDGL